MILIIFKDLNQAIEIIRQLEIENSRLINENKQVNFILKLLKQPMILLLCKKQNKFKNFILF